MSKTTFTAYKCRDDWALLPMLVLKRSERFTIVIAGFLSFVLRWETKHSKE